MNGDELPILVTQYLDGDQHSLSQLIDRFRSQVYGLCFRMLRQREDAEDATQETFVRVANNLHRWDSQRAFEPWLLTIAGNRCRTLLAKRKRRPHIYSLEFPIEDDFTDRRRGLLLAEEIELALTRIRSDYRQAFNLFHQHQMEYTDIATALDVPLGTVKTWVHRARREIVLQLKNRGVVHE
jgi:RNA polymerase sigma-70 factor (ECF subfamily)